MTEQIQRVVVWSGRLRIAHWSLAASTMLLLATGWLIAHSPAVVEAAVDLHYLGAAVLVFALALRLFLGFFGRGAERFEHLLPPRSEFRAMRASLLFYLSLGRTAQPRWYAHNPLWKPVYLVMLLVLTVLVITGWLMPDTPVLGGFYLPHLHRWFSDLMALLTVAHLYSVVLQDLKGTSADISAMFSGARYFAIQREGHASPDVTRVSIRLDDIDRP
jgi:Ni/Fe-hydrogenase 1 B-type cytochrome subunit